MKTGKVVIQMMVSIQSYVRRSRHILRKWSLDPRLHLLARAAAHFLAGLALSAASLGQSAMPFCMGLVCACTGWSAVLAAAGSVAGYWLFWGSAGYQGMVWAAMGLLAALALRDRRICRESPYFLPALGGVIVAASGVLFQTAMGDLTPIPIYLLRVALGVGSVWLLGLYHTYHTQPAAPSASYALLFRHFSYFYTSPEFQSAQDS